MSWLRLSAALALAVAPGLAAGCTSNDQEALLRAWVDQAVAEAERGDAAALLARTAGDFQLGGGRSDPRMVRMMVRAELQKLRQGSIHHPRPAVELDQDDTQARIRFPFLVVRGAAPPEGARGQKPEPDWLEAVADKTRLMRITLDLRRDGDQWLATSARLERFVGTGFRPVR